MITRTGIFLLLSMLIPLCAQTSENTSDCPVKIPYREWFLNPPSGMVSGFPLSSKKSHEDGYDRYCSYNRMRAQGILRFYENNGRIKHKQDSLYFYYDPNYSQVAPKDLFPADSFSVTKGHKVYIYSPVKAVPATNANMELCSSLPWNKNEEQSHRTYGYGVVAMSYYDHVGSWVTAESDAIRDILGKSAVLVASRQLNTESDFTEVYRYEYDLIVEGIRVERRWVDFNDWNCHVVVSAPRSGISNYVPSKNDPLSNQAISNTKTKPGETLQETDSKSEIQELSVPKTVITEPVGTLKVGSEEWYEMYKREQEKQVLKAEAQKKREQKEFQKEQADQYREFQREQKSP